MSPCSSPGADANPAERQVKIIVDDYEILGADGKAAEKLPHSRAALVHKGLGFDQKDLFPTPLPLTDERVKLFFLNREAIFRSDPIHNQETQVVPGPRIFPAWITQTENNLHVKFPVGAKGKPN